MTTAVQSFAIGIAAFLGGTACALFVSHKLESRAWEEFESLRDAQITGSPLRRPCQQGRQNSSRVPGFSLLLPTRSWLDRPRLCSRVAAALGRTSHHFGLSGLPPSASLPQTLIGSALASMWPVSAAQVTWFARCASNPSLARRAGGPCL